MKLMNKKAQSLGGLQGFILGIVSVAVILAVGLIVLGQLQSSTTGNSTEYNSTGTIITKLATVPTWIGIIITVALAFIVLGYFFSQRG